MEAEDDGLKYLKLNTFYNFRQAETDATALDAALPEMGGDNTNYDTRQMIFNTIQKQEKEEISQLEIDNSRKVVRKYSDFYLDPPCSQKLPGQDSSQRLFPQTKTMTEISVTILERRGHGLTSELSSADVSSGCSILQTCLQKCLSKM